MTQTTAQLVTMAVAAAVMMTVVVMVAVVGVAMVVTSGMAAQMMVERVHTQGNLAMWDAMVARGMTVIVMMSNSLKHP
jgi:hypothetical protein